MNIHIKITVRNDTRQIQSKSLLQEIHWNQNAPCYKVGMLSSSLLIVSATRNQTTSRL